MHIFYLFFVQFMQFPVIDFGLDHSGSRPFIYSMPKHATVNCTVNSGAGCILPTSTVGGETKGTCQ